MYANIEAMISNWQHVYKYFPSNSLMTHTRMTRTHMNDLKFISKHMEITIFGEMNEKEMELLSDRKRRK